MVCCAGSAAGIKMAAAARTKMDGDRIHELLRFENITFFMAINTLAVLTEVIV
jgi:hypothetical protein